MYKLLILLFYISFLYSSSNIDIAQLYNKKGISAVEKYLDEQLKTPSYWQKYLKNYDTSNGYYESIRYVIICQKIYKNITLYDIKNDKQLLKANVFIGEKNGDKQKEGDLKTPIGAYKLTQKLTKLDPFYGPLALTTNYPNLYDKIQGKTGHGIWIHGVPNQKEMILQKVA